MTYRVRKRCCSALALLVFAPIAGAQVCEPSWEAASGGPLNPGGELLTAVEFDDGSGLATYVGGTLGELGDVLAPSGFGRFRDGRLEVITGILSSSDFSATINAMLVHDDGSGPALYVAGEMRLNLDKPELLSVVRWRGGVWESFETGLERVFALAEFDEDGDGPAPPRLFAGGTVGEGVLHSIARWDGQVWSEVGPGQNNNGFVHALGVGDDGSGPALYVGGSFGSIGGVVSPRVARWDGVSWSAVGSGLPPLPSATSRVSALVWHDDGTGRALYAGGAISANTADGATHGMARWDGAQWRSLGLGEGSEVRGAASKPMHGANELVVAGLLRLSSGPAEESVARWSVGEFEAIPGPPRFRFPRNASFVPLARGVVAHEEGMLVLGAFDSVGDGDVAQNIAVWDGGALRPFVEQGGLSDGLDASALAVDPINGALYLGGDFAGVGGHVRPYLARFDEAGWSSVGNGLDGNVSALVFHDDGSGARLYAGGNFTTSGGVDLQKSIAVFDGGNWSRIATLNAGEALALSSIAGNLFAGGNFGTVDGVAARRIARHDGSGWNALGAGLSGGSGQVRAIIPWNSGVVVGGSFTNSGGLSLQNVAFWDGKAWSPLGDGFNFTVRALAEFRGELYAAGLFTQSGDRPVRYIAKWNGTRWRQLPVELTGAVRALRVFDDGSGPALYAAGSFGLVGGGASGSIGRWDGEAWSALGGGVTGRIDAIAPYAIGADRSGLFVSGVYTAVAGVPTLGIATWRGCFAACPGDANGDGQIDMADLMIVVDAFNTAEGDALFNGDADFDQNGAVDFEDLNLVIAGFNQGC